MRLPEIGVAMGCLLGTPLSGAGVTLDFNAVAHNIKVASR